MLHSPIAQISTALALLATLLAFAVGRWPERVAAGWFALDWAAGVLLQDHRPHHHLQPWSFGFDVGEVLLFLALVVACRRTWLLWAAALALLLVLTHVAVLLDLRFGQWSYLTANYVWSFGLTVAIGAGAAVEGRRPAPLPFKRLKAPPSSIPSATARSRS